MMDPLTPVALVAALGCAHACWTDVRTGKILNVLTLPMMGLGLGLNPLFTTWQTGVYGLLLAVALYYPLWRLNVQKGGDAKLWMGVGALMGPWFLLEATAWYAIVYVPVGFTVLLVNRRLGNLYAAARWSGASATGNDPGERPEPTMLRTAPVITIASVLAFSTHWLEFLFGWAA